LKLKQLSKEDDKKREYSTKLIEIYVQNSNHENAISEWRDQLTYLKSENQKINAWKNILSLLEESIESRKRRFVTEQYSKQSQQLKPKKTQQPVPTKETTQKQADLKLPKSSKLELTPSTNTNNNNATTNKNERTPEQDQLFQKLVKEVDEKFMEENNEVKKFNTNKKINNISFGFLFFLLFF